MSDPYQQHIIDRHKQPHHHGNLTDATHQLNLTNTLCGDAIHLDIVVKDGQFDQILWSGQGCAISTTATDILIDHIVNQPISRIEDISDQQFLDILGIELRPSRLKCALLGLNCLRQIK